MEMKSSPVTSMFWWLKHSLKVEKYILHANQNIVSATKIHSNLNLCILQFSLVCKNKWKVQQLNMMYVCHPPHKETEVFLLRRKPPSFMTITLE